MSFWNFLNNAGPRERCCVWMALRDSVGGAWHKPVQLTRLGLPAADWAPDGSGYVSPVGAEVDPGASVLVLVGSDGRVSRRAWPAASELRFNTRLGYSRDGRTVYGLGDHRDGRQGIWAIPVAGTNPRLVVAFDDPGFPSPGGLSVGPDRLYLTVSQYESGHLGREPAMVRGTAP